MREIKFRVWHKGREQMFDVLGINWPLVIPSSTLRCIDYSPDGGGPFDIEWDENAVLMQYTGLHDKNGKEIFEGDMLGTKGSESDRYPFYKTGYVIFENGAFTLQALGHDQKDERFEFRDDLEVIGDIYSNPDLLQ